MVLPITVVVAAVVLDKSLELKDEQMFKCLDDFQEHGSSCAAM